MSADDIIFDEVTYREPKRMQRPDRDPARACIACGTPGSDDLPIFLDRKPADLIERHALSDTSVELGGILLGFECIDEDDGRPFVWITEALEARHYENTQASFTYTHDSWEEISRERDARFPDLDIVGWYHTHPDFGIFLSSHDLFIHHNFFAQPLQIAYVVDPIRQTRGFFQWRDGRVEALGGFQLTASRGERLALARLANEMENLPVGSGADVGTGLGVLSPRLEAQLIAMLNRPHSTVVAAPGSAQNAATFGLIGAILGVLLLAAGLWLNSLAQTISEQSESIQRLGTALQSREAEVDLAGVRAKRQALDALLNQVRVGDGRQSFVTLYEQVAAERDQALATLAASQTDKNALNDRTRILESERETIDTQLAAARVRIDRLENSLALAESTSTDLDDRLKDQNKVLDETEAGTLDRKYRTAWYVAAGAIGACVLLGLGLIWAIARVNAPESAEEDDGGHVRPPTPRLDDPPPHRIV